MEDRKERSVPQEPEQADAVENEAPDEDYPLDEWEPSGDAYPL